MSIFKNKKIIIALIFIFLLSFYLNNLNFTSLDINNITYANIDDINYAIKNKTFGNFYSLKINNENLYANSNKNNNIIKVDLKLLNLITVKSFYINTNEEYIYAGGNAVGIYLNTKGVVLMGSNSIITKDGLVNTLQNSELQVGDILLKVNDEYIYDINDITNIINKEENLGKPAKIVYVRKNKEYETQIMPAKDVQSGEYKLGIWVKNDASGVGTLTYITEDGKFGALGHSINVNKTKEPYSISGGKLYNCNIIGVNKGSKGKAGELKGLFLHGRNAQGQIDKNINTGIYGEIYDASNLKESALKRKYLIGGRFTARPGKAKILSCVNGSEIKEYEIEIIKTNYQNTSREKSMVIKITDKELLEKTGGIVQGMSGSPIIQNGKLIGAVTHVFLNDSTKGFGLYLDWMIN
ncbi:MAG: SpoIVB peptidase [Clostridiales bacterium]|nr:SpoIVB peptidase [Clostridiales bacterium]